MENTSKRRSRLAAPPTPSKRFSNGRSARSARRGEGNHSELGPESPARPDTQENDIPASDIPASDIRAWKCGFDIGLILILLPVILILAVLVCCWIKVVSPGHVLFRQTRIGRGGKAFTIYKFRSMKPTAETSPHEAHIEHLIKSDQPMTKLDLTGDPRLIKGGRLIRMSGLDELPQLLNVLRGEMSLVGPRPCMPNEFALYDKHQLRRFSVPPGLTGLWQIERTRSTTFREMVAMDDLYVDRFSPALDLEIALKTPGVLLKQLGACVPRRERPRPSASTSFAPAPRQTFGNGMGATQKLAD